MVNSYIIKRIIDLFKLDIRVDKIPNPIPVVEVNGRELKTSYALATNSGGATIFTAPTDRDLYICGFTFAYIRDASATSTYHELRYTDEDNQTRRLFGFPCLTLTAGKGEVTMVLDKPIHVARGSNITHNSSTSTGNFQLACNILYYIDDVN
jgi:hypothetical protein